MNTRPMVLLCCVLTSCATTPQRQTKISDSEHALAHIQELAHEAREAERARFYEKAWRSYTRALSLSAQLQAQYPNSAQAVRLKNNPQLGGRSIKNIKATILPRLKQQALITSGLLGWAEFLVHQQPYWANIEKSQEKTELSLKNVYRLGRAYQFARRDDAAARLQRLMNKQHDAKGLRYKKAALPQTTPHIKHNTWVPICATAPALCALYKDARPLRFGSVALPVGALSIHVDSVMDRDTLIKHLLIAGQRERALQLAAWHGGVAKPLTYARFARALKNTAAVRQFEELAVASINPKKNMAAQFQELLTYYKKVNHSKYLHSIERVSEWLANNAKTKPHTAMMNVIAVFAEHTDNTRALKALTSYIKANPKTWASTNANKHSIILSYIQFGDETTALRLTKTIQNPYDKRRMLSRIVEHTLSQGKRPPKDALAIQFPHYYTEVFEYLKFATLAAKHNNRALAIELMATADRVEKQANPPDDRKLYARWASNHRLEIYAHLGMVKPFQRLFKSRYQEARRENAIQTRIKKTRTLLPAVFALNNEAITNSVIQDISQDIKESKFSLAFHLHGVFDLIAKSGQETILVQLAKAHPEKAASTALYTLKNQPKRLAPSTLLALSALAKKATHLGDSTAWKTLCAMYGTTCVDEVFARHLADNKKTPWDLSTFITTLAQQGRYAEILKGVEKQPRSHAMHFLSLALKVWLTTPTHAKQHPTFKEEVIKRQGTGGEHARPLRISLALAHALEGNCDRLKEMRSAINADSMSWAHRTMRQDASAATMLCFHSGALLKSLRMANTLPYIARARILTDIGRHVDTLGIQERPDIKRFLRQVAHDAFVKAP